MLTRHPVLIHLGLTTTLGNGVLWFPPSQRGKTRPTTTIAAGGMQALLNRGSRITAPGLPLMSLYHPCGSSSAAVARALLFFQNLPPSPTPLPPPPGTQPTFNCCQTGLLIPFSQWRSLKGLTVNDKFYPFWHGVGAPSPDPTIPFSLLCDCSSLTAQGFSHRGPLATSQAHCECPASSLCSSHRSALAYPLSLAGRTLPHFRDSSHAISYEQSFLTFPTKISPSLCFHISILTSIPAPVTLC